MRTIIKIMIITLPTCVLFSGCGTAPVDTDTLSASEQSAGARIQIHELPYSEIRYNSTSLSLESVDLYQLVSNYEHKLFVVTSYDIGKCSDEDRHWLFEQGLLDNYFDANCYIESEQNDIDFDSWSLIYKTIKDDTLYRLYYDETCDARHDFSDAEITIITRITQDEKDKDGRSLINEYALYCNDSKSEITVPLKDVSEMPSDIEELAIKGLEQSKESWQQLFEYVSQ